MLRSALLVLGLVIATALAAAPVSYASDRPVFAGASGRSAAPVEGAGPPPRPRLAARNEIAASASAPRPGRDRGADDAAAADPGREAKGAEKQGWTIGTALRLERMEPRPAAGAGRARDPATRIDLTLSSWPRPVAAAAAAADPESGWRERVRSAAPADHSETEIGPTQSAGFGRNSALPYLLVALLLALWVHFRGQSDRTA